MVAFERLVAVLVLGLLCSWENQMEARAQLAEDQKLAALPVEHSPEYIIGLPMYVAVTVRAGAGVSFYRLIFGNPVNLRSCLAVEATGPGKPIRLRPRPVVDETLGRRGEPLYAGESRRMLLDVSPLFEDVSEGEYSVRFTFIAPEASAEAGPVTLRFRRPTRAEESLVRLLAPDRPTFGTWGEWALSAAEHPIAVEAMKDAGPLAFVLALRHLINGSEPLSRVPPEIFDGLQGVYQPERDLIKAELYQQRGDSNSVETLTRSVREKTGGLDWWIKGINENAGLLTSLSLRPDKER